MTDAEVIAAIRARHLKANIAEFERAGFEMQWELAYLDPGGTIFGPGPYVKLPCRKQYERTDIAFFRGFGLKLGADDWDERVIRVYPPKRLRERLRREWVRDAAS
jgi:hypothetical protein